jgi:hypothetical protein
MIAELLSLALRAVVSATPSWALWLSLTSFMAVAGALIFFYERCRRRTYIAVLGAIQPGTLLLDRTHHCRELTVVCLPQPRFITHSNAAAPESLRR